MCSSRNIWYFYIHAPLFASSASWCLAEDSSDITFSGLLCLITRFHLVVYQSGCHLLQINIKLWLKVPKTIGKFITSYIKKCMSGLTLRLFDAMTYSAIKNPVLLDLSSASGGSLMTTVWLLWFQMSQPDTAVINIRRSLSLLTYFYFHSFPKPASPQVFWFIRVPLPIHLN